jgi:hypothetical protein
MLYPAELLAQNDIFTFLPLLEDSASVRLTHCTVFGLFLPNRHHFG